MARFLWISMGEVCFGNGYDSGGSSIWTDSVISCGGMTELVARLRGADKWPSATATVFATEEVSTGGRSGRTMNISFDYDTGTSIESGRFFVDDYSSLYGLSKGEQFTVQFDPKRPSRYYSSEARSVSQTIRRIIVVVGVAFAVAVFLIIFLGR